MNFKKKILISLPLQNKTRSTMTLRVRNHAVMSSATPKNNTRSKKKKCDIASVGARRIVKR
jgi:hypothetical protein